MAELTFHGLRAAYRTWANGTPVLFLHPGGAHGGLWEKVVQLLGPGWLAIAPDLLGFGSSARWAGPGELTLDLQAALADQVLAAAGIEGGVAVVGHSYGGATAVRLAADRPERVRSLVLIEPILYGLLKESGDPLFEESQRVGRTFIASFDRGEPEVGWREFIDSRNGAGTWDRLSDRRRQEFLALAGSTRDGFVSNRDNRTTLAECRAINVPVTVVCGGRTTAQDRRSAEMVRDAVPGARYETIGEAGHMSPLSHPREVAELVRAHLMRAAA